MPRRSADGLRYSSAAVTEFRAQLKHYAATSPGLDLIFADAVRKAEALAVGIRKDSLVSLTMPICG